MIVKGIIKTIDYTGNTCTVRIPHFETAMSDELISTATFAISPGMYNGYQVNDVVWLEFEGDRLEDPVVVGKLYLGVDKEKKSPRGVLNVQEATATQVATMPFDTRLSNEVDSAMPNTQASYSSLGKMSNKLNETNNNLARMDKDVGNKIQTIITDMDEQGNKLSSELSQTASNINAKVSRKVDQNSDEASGKTDSTFGWNLTADDWVVYSEENAEDALYAGLDARFVLDKKWVQNELGTGEYAPDKWYLYINGKKANGWSLDYTNDNPNETYSAFLDTVNNGSLAEIKGYMGISSGYWTCKLDGTNEINTGISATQKTVLAVDKNGLYVNGNGHFNGDGTFTGDITANTGYIGAFVIGKEQENKSTSRYIKVNQITWTEGTYYVTDNNAYVRATSVRFTDKDNTQIELKQDLTLSKDITWPVTVSYTDSNNEPQITTVNIIVSANTQSSTCSVDSLGTSRTDVYFNEDIADDSGDGKTSGKQAIGNGDELYLDTETSYRAEVDYYQLAPTDSGIYSDGYLDNNGNQIESFGQIPATGATGVYVGTDGIRVGSKFYVTPDGEVHGSGFKMELSPETLSQISNGNANLLFGNKTGYTWIHAVNLNVSSNAKITLSGDTNDTTILDAKNINSYCGAALNNFIISTTPKYFNKGIFGLYADRNGYCGLFSPKMSEALKENTTYTLSFEVNPSASGSLYPDLYIVLHKSIQDNGFRSRGINLLTIGEFLVQKILINGVNASIIYTSDTLIQIPHSALMGNRTRIQLTFALNKITQSATESIDTFGIGFISKGRTTSSLLKTNHDFEIQKIKLEEGTEATAFKYSDRELAGAGMGTILQATNWSDSDFTNKSIGTELKIAGSVLERGSCRTDDIFLVIGTAIDTETVYTIYVKSTADTGDLVGEVLAVIAQPKGKSVETSSTMYYLARSSNTAIESDDFSISTDTDGKYIVASSEGTWTTDIPGPTTNTPYVWGVALNIAQTRDADGNANEEAKFLGTAFIHSTLDNYVSVLNADGIDIISIHTDGNNKTYHLKADNLSGAMGSTVNIGGYKAPGSDSITGGWNIQSKTSSNDSEAAIYSGIESMNSDNTSGVYIGTDGIRLGPKDGGFWVDKNGTISGSGLNIKLTDEQKEELKGEPGADGKDGTNGKDGADGKDGKDGSDANVNWDNVCSALGITANSPGIYTENNNLLINASAIKTGVLQVGDTGSEKFKASIASNEVKIGGFTIDSKALYNGTSSMSSTTKGIYLGTDGIKLVGQKSYMSQTMKFNLDADAKGRASILQVGSLLISGSLTGKSAWFDGVAESKDAYIYSPLCTLAVNRNSAWDVFTYGNVPDIMIGLTTSVTGSTWKAIDVSSAGFESVGQVLVTPNYAVDNVPETSKNFNGTGVTMAKISGTTIYVAVVGDKATTFKLSVAVFGSLKTV